MMYMPTSTVDAELSSNRVAFQRENKLSAGLLCRCGTRTSQARLSANGVDRICYEEGQRWKSCHRALTMNFRAGCSSWLMVLWLVQYWSKELLLLTS